MKISNEELNQMLIRADYEFDSIKDQCHDLYDENIKLKEEIKLKQQNMNEQINTLYKTIEAKDKIINEQVLEIARLNKKNDVCEHYSFLLIPDENGTIYDANKKKYRLERIDENRE